MIIPLSSYYEWCDAGIIFTNGLLDENNAFLSFNRYIEIAGIETTFSQYMEILHMIPQIWKVRNLQNKSQ